MMKKRSEKVKRVAKQKSPKERCVFKRYGFALIAAVVLFLTGWYFCTVLVNNDQFDVSFYELDSEKIDSPIRTVVLADMHQKTFSDGNALLYETIRNLKPDFISVVGDAVTEKREDVAWLREFCSQLVSIAPVYYSLGNHEISAILYSGKPIKQVIGETGVTLLNDEVVTVSYHDQQLAIGGLSRRREDIKKVAPDFMQNFLAADGFHLLLTHYPENFDGYLENEAFDLALSGHAHGGQIRLPFVGAVYTQDQGLFPKLTQGMHLFDHGALVISRGLGDSSPFPRINNPPELVVVDIF